MDLHGLPAHYRAKNCQHGSQPNNSGTGLRQEIVGAAITTIPHTNKATPATTTATSRANRSLE
ncbi:hypothetical protein HMPREF9621_00875 [Cutibacterium modestum HL037PA2]|nr:hypothetical protein HMPREF9621_00875 [Cutibacterium modestum HL037PA2]